MEDHFFRRHNSCVDFTFLSDVRSTNSYRLTRLNFVFEKAAERGLGGVRVDKLGRMLPADAPFVQEKYKYLLGSRKESNTIKKKDDIRVISRGPFLAMFGHESISFINTLAINEKVERDNKSKRAAAIAAKKKNLLRPRPVTSTGRLSTSPSRRAGTGLTTSQTNKENSFTVRTGNLAVGSDPNRESSEQVTRKKKKKEKGNSRKSKRSSGNTKRRKNDEARDIAGRHRRQKSLSDSLTGRNVRGIQSIFHSDLSESEESVTDNVLVGSASFPTPQGRANEKMESLAASEKSSVGSYDSSESFSYSSSSGSESERDVRKARGALTMSRRHGPFPQIATMTPSQKQKYVTQQRDHYKRILSTDEYEEAFPKDKVESQNCFLYHLSRFLNNWFPSRGSAIVAPIHSDERKSNMIDDGSRRRSFESDSDASSGYGWRI